MTYRYRKLAWLVGIVFLTLTACRPEDESKLVPENRKGNILNELSARPEFSLFVEAINRTGYKNAIGGAGGLYTVFAPGNQAVQEFLTANGYSSLADPKLPANTLNKFLGNHFIPNSMLYPTDIQTQKFNGKKDNRYQSSGDKFLTVFYTDASNVTVNGAKLVNTTPVATGNGVFYQVERFLVPQRSADSLWQTASNYSLFYQLIKRFRYIEFDPSLRPNPIFNPITGKSDSVKSVLSRLAWNPASDNNVITFLAPNNEAMTAYLTANNYANVDAIPESTARKIAELHMLPPPSTNDYLKPRSKADFTTGVTFRTAFRTGTPVANVSIIVGTDISAGDIVEPDILVSNGIVHGISKVIVK